MKTALHVVNSINPEHGGTSVSVLSLARASASNGRYSSVLLHSDDKNQYPVTGTSLSTVVSNFSVLKCSTNLLWGGEIEDCVRNADIIHIHGLWDTSCITTGLLAHRYKQPVVISAHGMLDPWALRNKAWKKRLYSMLVERPNLRRAAVLRALTYAEADDYRRFGLSNPVVILPNGVDDFPVIGPETALIQWPEIRKKTIVLFLGRVHYKKGLDLLVRAWHDVASRFPDAHLVIAGPDSEGTLKKITQYVNAHSLNERVTFAGPVFGNLKLSLLRAATVFVLPSYSEGFPIAALESLAAGVPLVITTACQMSEVGELRAGWLISPNVPELTEALNKALICPAEELRAMGQRGCNLIRNKYGWTRIGDQMADTFDWILGGPRPTSVDILD
jgi:glycosyltransferase involved in cell wall biosynthesis